LRSNLAWREAIAAQAVALADQAPGTASRIPAPVAPAPHHRDAFAGACIERLERADAPTASDRSAQGG
jgi:hypothetical protein